MTILKEGDKAPAFTGKDQNGQRIALADYKGKKVVLYFYPADDTPTCTVQACNLRDNYSLLKREGFSVIGVSPDDEKSHLKFEKKFTLPFPLVADPDHTIIDKYGVWGEKQLYGRKYIGLHRTTFLIDEKGVIQKIFLKPRSKQHAEEITKAWAALSGAGAKPDRAKPIK
jgi:peroxiredoxin Q/BCP